MRDLAASLQLIQPDELDVLIQQARSEGWTELVLLGPDESFLPILDGWPDDPKRHRKTYQLTQIIDNLVERLCALANLTSLNLRGNKIGDADAMHIAALKNLTSLDLAHNEIGETGAKHIAALTNLTSLNLLFNKIGDAGAKHIAALTNLTSLDLGYNKIGKTGMSHIRALGNLTSLDLNGNNFGDAGAKHIASLTNLTSLNMWDIEIGDAGAKHLAALTNLTSLYISDSKIGDAGARCIAAMRNLTSLIIQDSQIGDAGAKHVAAMTNLNALFIRSSQIGHAGAKHLAALTNLTSLDLDNNQIGDAGAKHIAALTNLTSLNLGNNQIGDSGAKHIAALTNLRSLNLGKNQIGDAGAKQLSRLSMLHYLDIEETLVTDLTPFSGLSMLHTLNVAATSVSSLTPLTKLIEKGVPVHWGTDEFEGILVTDCPLTHPPPEVVKQGNEAVLNYLREIATQGVDRLFEAKVLLVGEGRAGKTSLLRRLYQPDASLPKEDETTKGIDIYSHEFPMLDGRLFRLNIWDFGGQEIYHATHQFFLTKRSLYILLDDTAKDNKTARDPGFKYWLEVVESLSDQSPVLIFQNEKGGRSKAIDEAGIKGRFPNVKAIYRGDLNLTTGADTLRNDIQFFVQKLPHIGEEVPSKWVSIRAEIEARAQNDPYISEKDYFEIYGNHLDFDRDKARHLSNYLHDLGVFLHFQDNALLRRVVILENEWATEAVFRILDDEQTKANQGRFTTEDCAQLWSDSKYVDMRPELISLMEQFEICYRLSDVEPATWLAPQLFFPSMPDVLIDWGKAEDLVLSYRYDFLPKGLISRLIVRMNRYVKEPKLAWTGGALFERHDSQVLVRTTERGDEVVLRARGPERKTLLSVLVGDLEALNASFGALEEKVEKRVPCICSVCRESSQPEFFNERKLLKRKKAHQHTVECDESFEGVSVLALLDGLKFEDLPHSKKPDQEVRSNDGVVDVSDAKEHAVEPATTRKTVKIFLASSKELESDRNAFDLYFRQQNDWLCKEGLYLEIIRWENFIDAMSNTRLQDEYNEAVRQCDIFVSLFSTKVGKYAEEEFDVAHEAYRATQIRPLVYTFFKDTQINTADADREALMSLWAFQEKLKKLGHFYTQYNDIGNLKLKFSDQLHKLRESDALTIS